MHPSHATYREPELSTPAGFSTAVARQTGPARPRILVLLATYNGATWIREQLESILAQRDVDVRVAVRDDCSSDGTRLELARFANDPRVRVAVADAPSGSAAANFLTLISENPAGNCELIAFADQDDCWNPEKLARAGLMLASSRASGYSSATLAVWENGRERLLRPSGLPTAADFLFEGAGQGCTFVLTAALYEEIRRFLARHRPAPGTLHYHDWLVYALARAWNMQWFFDTQPSMKYRQHAGNDTGARGTLDGIVKRLARIRVGWYRTQLSAIAAACAEAAPDNMTVRAWFEELLRPDSWRRRVRIARFCLHGGRRRTRDNLTVVLAALCGWI
jgi:rhamnosyltransferase